MLPCNTRVFYNAVHCIEYDATSDEKHFAFEMRMLADWPSSVADQPGTFRCEYYSLTIIKPDRVHRISANPSANGNLITEQRFRPQPERFRFI